MDRPQWLEDEYQRRRDNLHNELHAYHTRVHEYKTRHHETFMGVYANNMDAPPQAEVQMPYGHVDKPKTAKRNRKPKSA
ncbi:hypothetical protein [Mesorhizobium sp. B2-3-10]|uniref:hypothetical protein n=1 Tax=Mesorhizobium sp. B2-3-10 TaxID=2589954 RepID=UPI001125C928|nr:hypothetical protein [Mesorhizobium sp. B2-3-10]TPL98334.1 hypothetical protein FJ943_15635 [Mesorhizobium sp. B2-3-10]